ncbi:hypothetical protein PUNSTDRAFT_126357 [Punctularia strigosozonata HHB-11173 SS5]|uniref:uncharacterized protein n=1 Tax=Punctularia strigosozonata (strain HHB-11173) TaxID=741275 RepID=UPI000441798C|nr:uncharacterized protein PUNSTDRAFT_126357 [Punctularia strigosozonata HHB-11173 SS5]EIN08225.1 hypothetical protein PUNSTDRAFT_126357 [Punctularia strigosozonata HHB-11173 SS5]
MAHLAEKVDTGVLVPSAIANARTRSRRWAPPVRHHMNRFSAGYSTLRCSAIWSPKRYQTEVGQSRTPPVCLRVPTADHRCSDLHAARDSERPEISEMNTCTLCILRRRRSRNNDGLVLRIGSLFSGVAQLYTYEFEDSQGTRYGQACGRCIECVSLQSPGSGTGSPSVATLEALGTGYRQCSAATLPLLMSRFVRSGSEMSGHFYAVLSDDGIANGLGSMEEEGSRGRAGVRSWHRGVAEVGTAHIAKLTSPQNPAIIASEPALNSMNSKGKCRWHPPSTKLARLSLLNDWRGRPSHLCTLLAVAPSRRIFTATHSTIALGEDVLDFLRVLSTPLFIRSQVALSLLASHDPLRTASRTALVVETLDTSHLLARPDANDLMRDIHGAHRHISHSMGAIPLLAVENSSPTDCALADLFGFSPEPRHRNENFTPMIVQRI